MICRLLLPSPPSPKGLIWMMYSSFTGSESSTEVVLVSIMLGLLNWFRLYSTYKTMTIWNNYLHLHRSACYQNETGFLNGWYTPKNKGSSRCHRIKFFCLNGSIKKPSTSEEPFCFKKGSLFAKEGSSDYKKVRKRWFFDWMLLCGTKIVILWLSLWRAF